MPKEEKAIIMNLQYESGDITEDIWRAWKEDSRKTAKVLFKCLLIHAADTNFDPLTCPVKWEEEK